MDKVGVGIIGCGWVAEEHIKAFQNDGRAAVRGLMSRRRQSAEAYRQTYALDCTAGTDLHALLAQDDIDLVVVATPHDLHTEQVVAALMDMSKKKMSRQELDRLAEMIEKARREGR